MTETADITRRTPAFPRNGLRAERLYTTEGVHPYDEVTWERRDVLMTNWRDGSINFDQKGVEFPDFWSVNAANIVTTKYFRGAVGTPQREHSLRQLIDRPALAGPPHPVDHLVPAERLGDAAALDHREGRLLNGGEPSAARLARAPPPDRLPLVHLARVDHARIGEPTVRTPHRVLTSSAPRASGCAAADGPPAVDRIGENLWTACGTLNATCGQLTPV